MWTNNEILKLKGMKHLFSLLLLVFTFSGCSKLKDTKLNDNPYDKDYTGTKVVNITGASTIIIDASNHFNQINVATSTTYYQNLLVYRNGAYLKRVPRASYFYGSHQQESILDSTSVIGTTYSYQVKLNFEVGYTSLSDGFDCTTQ